VFKNLSIGRIGLGVIFLGASLLLVACSGNKESGVGGGDVVPSLEKEVDQVFEQGRPITVLKFTNTGGGELIACQAEGLPNGLDIAISEDKSTCEISGTPTDSGSDLSVMVSAENASGSQTIEIVMAITPAKPNLSDPGVQTYIQGNSISVLSFTNTGGALSSCMADSLPDGLSIDVSADKRTCEIQGVPTTVQDDISYTVTAKNTSGESEAVLIIIVDPKVPSMDIVSVQTFIQNTTISALSLVNNGGELVSCEADSLPMGLTLDVSQDKQTCEINGAPTSIQQETIHTITAKNASGQDSVEVSIIVNALAPLMVEIPTQIYVQNQPIETVSLINNGGQLTACVSNNLPKGLSVEISADQQTCQITGTPTMIQALTTHRITATNSAANDEVDIDIIVNPIAPDLLDEGPSYVFSKGISIPRIILTNTGGGQLVDCTSDDLPNGLVVAVSNDKQTCEISGLATQTQDFVTHDITATNVTGNSKAQVTITINPIFPVLLNASMQNYELGKAITPLSFVNNGGGELSACTANSLPAGLKVDVSLDATTCVVTGTPLMVQDATTHTITATNVSGSNDATVVITNSYPTTPFFEVSSALSYAANSAIPTFSFINHGGGTLTECSGVLPDGLSVSVSSNGATCEITGTPTVVNANATYTILAMNAEGSGSVDIDITIEPEVPFVTMWKTDNPGATNNNQIMIDVSDDWSYNYNVEWGDGVVSTGLTMDTTYTYAVPGTYEVKITGNFPAMIAGGDARKLVTVEQWGNNPWRSMRQMFKGAQVMTFNTMDAPDLSLVEDMSEMFSIALMFDGDISDWDVSSVTNMDLMFNNASVFNQDISGWNVSLVTTMNSMFYAAYKFDQPIGIWDVSSVKDMSYMLENAEDFNQDIGDWKVNAVLTFEGMFNDAVAFNQDISDWETTSATNMSGMFSYATNFDQNLGGWDVSLVTTMSSMFANVELSTANYDALLNGWSTQMLQSNVQFGAGDSSYSNASQAARDILTGTYQWQVSDQGIAP